MRHALSATFCLTLSVCIAAQTVIPSTAYAAQPSDEEMAKAKELYQEGEGAYRLGDFEAALPKFQEAYKLSRLPLMLQNIGLTLKRLGDQKEDLESWRKAKSVLENFALEIQKDPELGDLGEVEKLLEELEGKIAKAEEEEAAKRAAEAAASGEPYVPVGPDPGEPLRKNGKIWLYSGVGAGGAFIVGGAVAMAVLGLRGNEFEQDLGRARTNIGDFNCRNNPTQGDCPVYLDQEQTAIDNGEQANLLLLGVGLPLIGIGLAGLGVGLGVGLPKIKEGNKKTERWEKGPTVEVQVAPTRNGLVISGRF